MMTKYCLLYSSCTFLDAPRSLSQLKYCLCEADIDEDLAIISKISGRPLAKKPLTTAVPSPAGNVDIVYDARIDDGRLYYEKKW